MKMNKEKILFHAIYVMAIVMLLFGDLYSQKNECIDYMISRDKMYLHGTAYKTMKIAMYDCDFKKINNQNELKVDIKVFTYTLLKDKFEEYMDTCDVIVDIGYMPAVVGNYSDYVPYYILDIPLALTNFTLNKDCIYVVNIKIYKELTNKVMKQLQIQFYERG